MSDQSRHWRLKYPKKSLLRLAQKRAKSRGTVFLLTEEDVVIPSHCPILGIPLYVGNRQLKDNSPTLDEVMPGWGYVPANVRVISWRANRLKSDATPQELTKIVTYVNEHLDNWGATHA